MTKTKRMSLHMQRLKDAAYKDLLSVEKTSIDIGSRRRLRKRDLASLRGLAYRFKLYASVYTALSEGRIIDFDTYSEAMRILKNAYAPCLTAPEETSPLWELLSKQVKK